MNLGLGLFLGSRGGSAVASPFDPSPLALTGWWRASYAGAPWNGTASGGASSGRNAASIGFPPAVGAALNGLAPPDFDGVDDNLALGVAISSFISAGGWTLGVLLNADTLTANDASPANNQLLFGDGAGFWGLYAGVPGLQLFTNDGTPKVATASISTGAWIYAHCTFDGAAMKLDIGGVPATAASGGPSSLVNGLRFGQRSTNPPFDGRIAEIMVGATNGLWSRAQGLSYLNARYGLNLT